MYRNKLSPLALEEANDVIVDIWIGSSENMGIKAFTADLISPTAAAATTPLTISKIWDRWMNGTYRLAGHTAPDSFGWDLTPLVSGSVSNTTTFAYAQGLYYQTRKPVLAPKINLDTTPYHYTVSLGISTSAVNDRDDILATKLAHWSPNITGVGELVDLSTDMGALEHLRTNYIGPAIKNLQAAGKRVFIGGLYVSISGDALSAYSEADALSWASHFGMIRRNLETFLDFQGIPVVILGVSQCGAEGAEHADVVREQQRLYAASNPGTTLFFNTAQYPTYDLIHFDGQATLDIGGDVTAFRYGKRDMGLALITKAF